MHLQYRDRVEKLLHLHHQVELQLGLPDTSLSICLTILVAGLVVQHVLLGIHERAGSLLQIAAV